MSSIENFKQGSCWKSQKPKRLENSRVWDVEKSTIWGFEIGRNGLSIGALWGVNIFMIFHLFKREEKEMTKLWNGARVRAKWGEGRGI